MNIAKPPGGFNIVVTPPVQAFVDDLFAHHPELPRHWRAGLDRLRQAAHTMGEAIDGHPGQRAAIVQPFHNGPNIWLAWRVLGDTVTILRADL